jgi:pyruvate carboxylase
MNFEIKYSKQTQKNIDTAQNILNEYDKALISRLEGLIALGDISWREAREAFLADDMRSHHLNTLTEIMSISVPSCFTLVRENS